MKWIVRVLGIALLVFTLPAGLSLPAPVAAQFVTPIPSPTGTADLSSPGIETAPSLVSDAVSFPAQADRALIERLEQQGGSVRVVAHAATGRARFLGASTDRPGFRGIPTGLAGRPEAAARAFFKEYGPLFGVSRPESLRVMKQRTDEGRTFVRFQQTVNGIHVIGGELIVQADAAGRIWSASGEALPDNAAGMLAVLPELTEAEALELGLQAVTRQHAVPAATLETAPAELWYYSSSLLGTPGPAIDRLVWRTEVRAQDLAPIRELVLIDALTGKILLHFNQIPHAKQRIVYDNVNSRSAGLPGGVPVRTEGQAATGNVDADLAYEYAGNTYDFYLSRHGRDSIDNAGLPIISTVRYCSPNPFLACPYPNAFWDGAQMVYGEGYAAADDVVAHELTHGVTDHESRLFYYMQSGALNESLSDIWGEYVDQVNSMGNDSPSVRWLVGEDVPGGALRNMENPLEFNDPDRVSNNYWCDGGDNGGVHINSGIPNKAASLMTDGGTFNGKTVAALGLEKVVHIWYRLATQMTTSAAEFQDVYDLLPQACTDLATAGAAGITHADCPQVKNALDATEMNLQPASCVAAEAPICAANETATSIYSEDFEDQGLTLGRWSAGASVGPNPWYYPQTANPYGLTDILYATSGQYHLWGDSLTEPSDGWIYMANGVTVPVAGKPYFRFHHAYAFETGFVENYDGGVLEVSFNGGPWTDAGNLFTHNGYDGFISGVTNPLVGREAFLGLSWGYKSSRLNLSSLKGQSVRFRFRVGADEQVADWGWFVDDVELYTCAANLQANHRARLPLIVR